MANPGSGGPKIGYFLSRSFFAMINDGSTVNRCNQGRMTRLWGLGRVVDHGSCKVISNLKHLFHSLVSIGPPSSPPMVPSGLPSRHRTGGQSGVCSFCSPWTSVFVAETNNDLNNKSRQGPGVWKVILTNYPFLTFVQLQNRCNFLTPKKSQLIFKDGCKGLDLLSTTMAHVLCLSSL